MIYARSPVSGGVPRPDLEFPVVLRMERVRIPEVGLGKELALDLLGDGIEPVRRDLVIGKRQAIRRIDDRRGQEKSPVLQGVGVTVGFNLSWSALPREVSYEKKKKVLFRPL